jgi:hypothetical protein
MDSYELEKPVWDDSDFDAMGWHDARIPSQPLHSAASSSSEIVSDEHVPLLGRTFWRMQAHHVQLLSVATGSGSPVSDFTG